MSPRTGRPTNNPKTVRLEIRMTKDESRLLEACAKEMNATKTDVIKRGIELVENELKNKKE